MNYRVTNSIISVLVAFVNRQDICFDDKYLNGQSWTDTIDYRTKLSSDLHFILSKGGKPKPIFKKIICNWGGIWRFKSFYLVDEAINSVRSNRLLNSECTNRVSSISKVLSFYDPKNLFVLDARVSLFLNSIILLNNVDEKLIPFQEYKSRSVKLRLAYKRVLSKTKGSKNIPHSTLAQAYNRYCEIIKQVHQNSRFKNENPEIIEMILFKSAKLLSDSNIASLKVKV